EDETFDSYFMEEEPEEKSEQSYYEIDEEEFDEQEALSRYYWEEGLDTELEDKELEEELSSKTSLTKLVKNALINKQWSLAIGLSIHAGNRDENSLTDMIFHARYPERKGRKLKRRERKLIKEWLKIRNTLVRKQLALPSPPIAQRGGIKCVSRRERKLADEKPDNPKTNITGRYENRFFDKKTRITVTTLTLNINQAGKHIECVMTEVLSPKSKKKKIPIYRLHGDLQNDGSYTLFSRTQPNFYARLYRRNSRGSLLMKIQTSSGKVSRERFVLNSSNPTLMEKPLSILPKGSGIIKRSQWTPLTREQLRYLRKKLAPNQIIPYLKRYFSIDSDTDIDIRERLNLSAKQFDNYLEDIVFSEKFWHPTQLNLATFYAQRILAGNRWTYKGVKRSFLDWIQIMLSIVASNREDWGRLRNIRKYLRIKADKDLDATRPPHTYKVTIIASGLAAGSIISPGLFVGTIIIEKTSEPKWEKGKQEYAFWFGGISVGVGKVKAKMGVFAKGTATTSNNWTPGDFPGGVSLVEGGVSAGVGIGGQAGETLMFIDGRGFYPTMKVDLSGLSGTSQIGAGVEIGLSWGRIFELGRDFSKQDVSEIKIKTDYSV
ncbi:MAG: hypothetical protein WBM44_07120, partial [Waterburya sp.]